MIVVRNLTKQTVEGVQLLSKVSFQADDGDFIAIVGASGSGKTTLLKCLSLQEKWSQGQYINNNRDITAANPLEAYKWKRSWAFLTETPDVDLQQTALKNVLAGRFQHLPWFRKLTRTVPQSEHILGMDALEKVGLIDKAHDKLQNLSGGERQRVAIAKALVKEAKVIFADEPVKGLPPEAQNRVMEDFRAICKREQVTVFCAIGNIDLAERYASRIWGLAGGKLVVDVTNRRLTQQEKDLIFR